MSADAFLDTSILLYAFAEDARAPVAEALLRDGAVVSVQVLNEFSAVARRKLGMPWPELREALDAIRILCPDPLPLTLALHEAALDIAEQHGYDIYDSLIIAAALQAGCRTLYSEDMQHGQAIADLTIRNPFGP